jgi:hypothetical protein
MDTIDSELRRALAVDPSPELLARIRTRVAAEPVHGRFAWAVTAPIVFAIAVVVVAVFLGRPPARLAERTSAALAARALAPAMLVPAPMATSGPIATAVSSPRGQTRVRTTPRTIVREPEALIAADEMKALQQLIRNGGRAVIGLPPESVTPPEGEIIIEPIAIEPIPPVTGTEGAHP